jgi:hypothetical protein
MKKLLLIALTSMLCSTIFASEAEIRALFAQIHQYTLKWQMQELMQFYTADYVVITADGRTYDYQTIRKVARASDAVVNPDSTLTEVMTAALELQGQVITAEQIAQFKEFENTKVGNLLMLKVRDAANSRRTQMQGKLQAVVDSFTPRSITVNGNNAVIVYTDKDLNTGKLKETTCTLVKQNNKWLISKEAAKFIEK